MGLKKGVIGKITSSLLVSYKNPDNGEKMVIDIGLNIKNFQKKVHIPKYVRFTSSGDNLANNQYDNYTHNTFARGAKHIRPHWEYSFDCVEILKEYKEKFPLVFEYVLKSFSRNSAVGKLKDLYGGEDASAVGKLKTVLQWIESLPISQLPYVEVGFDTLDIDVIKNINEHRDHVANNFTNVSL